MAYTLANVHPGEVRQVLHVDVGRQLAIGLSLGEQVAEHVGVDVAALDAGQNPVFVAVALEDRLDDQIARVAGHRPFQAAQRRVDHGLDLVVGAGLEHRADRLLRRPRPGKCRRQWSWRIRWCATAPWPPAPGRAWFHATARAETRPGADYCQRG